MPNSQPAPRILIVDDDPLLRELVERSLASHFKHADFVRAEDGVDGLERCLREPFDLIVTDIRMPRLTGIEMLFGVRENGIDTPVIVLSGSELPDQDLSAAGVFVYLSKADLLRLPAIARQLLDLETARTPQPVLLHT